MIDQRFINYGTAKNAIRMIAEAGAARKAEIGAENVYDFSIGNPSIPAPACLDQAIRDLLDTTDSIVLHAYTPADGLYSLKQKMADDLNARYDANIVPELIYVIMGASAGLASAIRALVLPEEEVIAFAPYFMEYKVFTEACNGKLVTVSPDEKLQPDLGEMKKAITEKTKMVIINSPNNPSGVILTRDTLEKMADILREAQETYGHPIYLLSDEPYRELVYDGQEVPCVVTLYDNSILVYSYSKSLSLPGERIGYLAVSSTMEEKEKVYAAIFGAARANGYINPPSLIQRALEKCIGQYSDLHIYKENRDLLYNMLTEIGFDCVYPDGAFYLFMKAPEPDALAFAQRALKHELLLVPSNDFGVTGYVRIAYCVTPDMIRRSEPAFRALAKEYGIGE